MSKKYFLTLLVLLVVVAGGAYALLFHSPKDSNIVASYEECVAAGNPVMESYPPQCRTKDGQTFTENIGNAVEKIELIQVTSPRPNQTITSPLSISGQARGTWYFEASFSGTLVDANDKVLVEFPIQATGEWMTTEFVPFTTTINFPSPTTPTGTLILKKSNASGLPEHDDQLNIPIKFN